MELADCECVIFAENRCSTSLCVPCSAALSGAGSGSVIRKVPQYYNTAFTNLCTAIKNRDSYMFFYIVQTMFTLNKNPYSERKCQSIYVLIMEGTSYA